MSTLLFWLGWEVAFEFWRRWRSRTSYNSFFVFCAHRFFRNAARPAIEPISLSLHSFAHFAFLLHIRLSPLDTPHASDILPETCHSLIQLAPGLVPLLPRAAIAVVLLTTLSSPVSTSQASVSSIDQTNDRNPNYFDPASSGTLTSYARGILFSLLLWVTIRLLVILVSAVVLWSFSCIPLGGSIGSRYHPGSVQPLGDSSILRNSARSTYKRDPAQTRSYQKCGISEETEFQWEWKDRARSRIQNAFELCMMRQSGATVAIDRGSDRIMEQTEDFAKTAIMEMSSALPVAEGRAPSRDIQLYSSSDPSGIRSVSTTDDLLGREPTLKLGSRGHLSLMAYDSAASTSSVDLFCTPMGSESPASENHCVEAESHDNAHSWDKRVYNISNDLRGFKPESMGLGCALQKPKAKDLIGQRPRQSSEQSSPRIGLRHSMVHMCSPVSDVPSTHAHSTSVNLQQLKQSSCRDPAGSEGIVKRVKSGLTSGLSTPYELVNDGQGINEAFERKEREWRLVSQCSGNSQNELMLLVIGIAATLPRRRSRLGIGKPGGTKLTWGMRACTS